MEPGSPGVAEAGREGTCTEWLAGGGVHLSFLSPHNHGGRGHHRPHLAQKVTHTWVAVGQPRTQCLSDPKACVALQARAPARTLQTPVFSSWLTLDFS